MRILIIFLISITYIYKEKKSWIAKQLDKIGINRNYIDRLFIKVFNDKQSLLQLYNAVNNSNYENADELIKRELNNKYKLSQSEIEKYMK